MTCRIRRTIRRCHEPKGAAGAGIPTEAGNTSKYAVWLAPQMREMRLVCPTFPGLSRLFRDHQRVSDSSGLYRGASAVKSRTESWRMPLSQDLRATCHGMIRASMRSIMSSSLGS